MNFLFLVNDDFKTLVDRIKIIKLFYREYIGYDTECIKQIQLSPSSNYKSF